MGHAMEYIITDAIARYQRMMGRPVFFLTGTDEHGSKLVKTAQEKDMTPQEVCDMHAAVFMQMKETLELSFDDFIRTTDQERHWPSVQKIWQKLADNGDIYKDTYKGYYCVGCEAFITEKELEDGKCPTHKKEPEVIEEENYFFKLSKYSDEIIRRIEDGSFRIVPEFRQNEIVNVIKGGLRDVSFSRPKSTLPWGIPVPGDDSQVMYVWCDALTNYISALDYAGEGDLYQKFWNDESEKVHVIGKDILRFHAAIWPAMLISAGVPLPNSEYVHGFVTSDGEKMSKSIGNVVDPIELVEEYGVNALRLYLLKEIALGRDGDLTIERFESVYNSDLAHNLGNLVNRVLQMTLRYNPDLRENDALRDEVETMWDEYIATFDTFDTAKACNAVWTLLDIANKYIEDEKPWVLAKENTEKLSEVLYTLNEVIRHVSIALKPILPSVSNSIREWQGFEAVETCNEIRQFGAEREFDISKPEILFKKLED